MANYLVTWTIDIEDVDSPAEAARQALKIQRKKNSIATVFTVKDKRTGHTASVDLSLRMGDHF